MKSNTIFSVGAFFLLICLWACQNSETTPVENGNKKGRFNPRSGLDNHLTYQIAGFRAKQYIEEYQEYINLVDSTITKEDEELGENSVGKLIYGTKVDLKELKEILDSSDMEIDELYLMLGIMDTDSTELIFSLASIDSTKIISGPDTTISMDTTWTFFDFTMPCPTACPKFTSIF